MKIFSIINSIYLRFISPLQFAKIVGVKMGENCEIRTKLFGSEPYLISMGNNVATSGNVQFVTHDGSLHVIRNLYPKLKDVDLIKPIKIGNNVFIGLNVIILPGTIIGDNVVVGAGAITKGILKSNSVYAGVPAKFICSIDEYKLKNENSFIHTKHLNGLHKKNYLNKSYDIL